MACTSTKNIPKNKLEDFHKILCKCGGRYNHNPIDWTATQWRITFTYDDVNNLNHHNELWERVTKDIQEKDSSKTIWKLLKKSLRKLRFFFKQTPV